MLLPAAAFTVQFCKFGIKSHSATRRHAKSPNVLNSRTFYAVINAVVAHSEVFGYSIRVHPAHDQSESKFLLIGQSDLSHYCVHIGRVLFAGAFALKRHAHFS